MQDTKRTTGLRRLIDAASYSLMGLKATWDNEAAFRQEVALMVVLLPTAVWLGTTAVQRALLVGSSLLILIVELINSAIEAAIDRIGPEIHPLSEQAKNMGSAAVLLSLVNVTLVWGLVAWGRWAG
jgi:diacylglycerol kinase (ATP)